MKRMEGFIYTYGKHHEDLKNKEDKKVYIVH